MTRILAINTPANLLKRGQHHFWDVIKTKGQHGAIFTVTDIYEDCKGVDRATLIDYMRRLVLGGFLSCELQNGTNHYKLIKPQSFTPTLRRDGTVIVNGQQQLWNAIRLLKTFTLNELKGAAATEEYQPKLTTVKSYVSSLVRAGYITKKAIKTDEPWVFTLKMGWYTGPNAPSILRTKLIYDPNTNQVRGTAETTAGDSK